jgi:hypothetical protein
MGARHRRRGNERSQPMPPFLQIADPELDRIAGLEASGADEDEIAVEREREVWVNDRYTVIVRRLRPRSACVPPMVHLSIRRDDRVPVRDWRDLQAIKNALVGPECEGVELFPAESRLVDTANQAHLWVVADPTFRFGFGYAERLVTAAAHGNAKQRAFPQSVVDVGLAGE